MGPSGPGCPYHPLLLARPALDAADPMCHVYVEESDVLWTSGPSWLDLGNSGPGEAAMLQQYWAPCSRPLSAQQDSLPKVEAEVSTRLQNADRRYRSDVVAAAQQPGWEPDPVVGSPGSLPGTAAQW